MSPTRQRRPRPEPGEPARREEQRADAQPADRLLDLQQTHGNAYVSRLVAAEPAVARRKAPSAEESVGAQPGTAHFVEDPTTADPTDTLALGEAGFTFQMLKELPKAAGKAFGYYRDAHLTTVKPDFKHLDDKQLPYVSKQRTKAQDELDAAEGKGWSNFRTIPSVIRIRKDNRDYWQNKADQLAADRAREDQLVQNFNASVPRANHTFVSLARLEAMQEMLGVKSPKEMSDALVKSLKDAAPTAEGLVSKQGSLPLPEATEAVSGAAKRSTQAQKNMQAAWLGMQQVLIGDHVAELKKRGAKDEEELERINKVISFAREVGGAIDVSMAVMSGGAKMVEGTASGKLKPSQLMDLEADPDVSDKSGIEGAKKVGGALTKAMGIEIPTSAAGVLETATKIWYWSELEDIRKRLAALNTQMSAHEEVARKIGLKQKVEAFEASVAAFELANRELQDHVNERQRAYLKLGQRLDQEASKQSGNKAAAGKERFATVFTLVAAVREVLAIGREAGASFMDADALQNELAEISEHRASLKGLPRGEYEPLSKMLRQQLGFQSNLEALEADLGAIDAQAAQLMGTLSGDNTGAY